MFILGKSREGGKDLKIEREGGIDVGEIEGLKET